MSELSDLTKYVNDKNVTIDEFKDRMISYDYKRIKSQIKFNAWYFFIFYPLNIACIILHLSNGKWLACIPSMILCGLCIMYLVNTSTNVNKLDDIIIEGL